MIKVSVDRSCMNILIQFQLHLIFCRSVNDTVYDCIKKYPCDIEGENWYHLTIAGQIISCLY